MIGACGVCGGVPHRKYDGASYSVLTRRDRHRKHPTPVIVANTGCVHCGGSGIEPKPDRTPADGAEGWRDRLVAGDDESDAEPGSLFD